MYLSTPRNGTTGGRTARKARRALRLRSFTRRSIARRLKRRRRATAATDDGPSSASWSGASELAVDAASSDSEPGASDPETEPRAAGSAFPADPARRFGPAAVASAAVASAAVASAARRRASSSASAANQEGADRPRTESTAAARRAPGLRAPSVPASRGAPRPRADVSHRRHGGFFRRWRLRRPRCAARHRRRRRRERLGSPRTRRGRGDARRRAFVAPMPAWGRPTMGDGKQDLRGRRLGRTRVPLGRCWAGRPALSDARPRPSRRRSPWGRSVAAQVGRNPCGGPSSGRADTCCRSTRRGIPDPGTVRDSDCV